MKRIITMAATAAVAAMLAAVPFALGGGAAPNSAAAPFTYAVIGDTPYGTAQIANFSNDVSEINADPDVSLVLHLGDIKNGSTRCDDGYFTGIRTAFDGFARPLVYTPGDNEWTDCHRANNGGYVPTERLDALRETFFDQPGLTLGQGAMSVEAQGAPYVENVTWSRSRVQFGTVHVPGSNNDWAPWFNAAVRSAEQVAEYTDRNAANLAWVDHIFRQANRNGARGVVIGIQADMWDVFFSGPNDNPAQYDHFTDFVQRLARNTKRFGRPVLLLNGDSHIFVDDRPLADPARTDLRTMYGVTRPVRNLRRITVNGSATPCHEWLRLSVDPASPEVFTVTRERFATQPGFDPAVCPPAQP